MICQVHLAQDCHSGCPYRVAPRRPCSLADLNYMRECCADRDRLIEMVRQNARLKRTPVMDFWARTTIHQARIANHELVRRMRQVDLTGTGFPKRRGRRGLQPI